MLTYILRRFIYMIVLLWLVSLVAFIIMELPPGDYLSTYIAHLKTSGVEITEEQVRSLEQQYGLNQPMHSRYIKWLWSMIRGDFGRSFQWNESVSKLIAERLPFTIAISFLTMLFTYALAIPIGIYSATHQYSIGDFCFTIIGFMGLAIPNFLLALVLMYVFYKYFNLSAGGLFSVEYQVAPWNVAKIVDLLKHMPIPIIVIGTAGTAALIRVMRGCLLDELRKQYVITARAKGVSENRLLFKYPVRVSLNPVVSTFGWMLPRIVSGETITAIVLSLPTVGPLLFQALLAQDMHLAGAVVMILSALVVIGTLISDIMLVWLDPRIRYERVGK